MLSSVTEKQYHRITESQNGVSKQCDWEAVGVSWPRGSGLPSYGNVVIGQESLLGEFSRYLT